ncbi:L-threonylcarbamoyladenylate synthase [Actinoplanes sp. NBRC 103695]|uniref:L-threonylcarbamoyladenylate synthase n=1 Tax=Actinoplanes sp. NBRC 103695 TaxID=3032202 RepID=UPI0025538211|nr:L-threonylcarbamoyladenylate synthase [Actinoplanes sp. NBRC 103695]
MPVVLPDAAGLHRAAELLRAGSVVAFPTETVYGLGAHAFSEKAVAEIYRLKNRPSWNPLIVHVPSVGEARRLAAVWPAVADDLAARFWPGPLTLVVRRAPHLTVAGAANDTIAIRVPAHDVALRLLEAAGLPLAAPSANRSEGLSPTTAEHVVRGLPDVPLVLDGGACRWGIESTVLDVTGDTPRLLRPGALSLRAIREVTGRVALPDEVADGAERPSPGMGKRHYAPRARLLLADEISQVERTFVLAEPVGLLALEGEPAQDTEILGADPEHYAADLYAALHRLDDRGVATIIVQRPPATEEWLAVHDRLNRAAAR